MEPLPPLPTLEWPAPNADGSYTVSVVVAGQLLQLLNTLRTYLETEYIRCGKK